MKYALKQLFQKNSHTRNVFLLISGTVIAQLLAIVITPIITRLYSPEEFGQFTVFSSILGIFVVIANLRYEQAIPLSNDNEDAFQILTLCIAITTAFSILTAVIILVWGVEILNKLNITLIEGYLILLPIGVFVGGIHGALNYWAVRVKGFKNISQATVYQTFATLVVQLSAYKIGSIALILAPIFGQIV